MSDKRATDLIERGDTLFAARPRLLNLWQEIASMFYVERADFTVSRLMGDSFADWLMTSYPLIARRDLGNAFSAMLRPTDKDWFRLGTLRPDREDVPARVWLDNAPRRHAPRHVCQADAIRARHQGRRS